eukprot:PITA_12884
MRAPPAPLHPIVVVDPFSKWGIDFVTYNPRLTGGHGYIILVVNCFTKWVEVMPTYRDNDEIASIFIFNHVIARFDILQAIVTDHGSHFRNFMMVKLSAQLNLSHDRSTPYYPQANGQVEDVNKVLTNMIKWIVDEERFVHLAHLNENRCNAILASEAHQKHAKAQYVQNINPRTYSEGGLVLVCDQAHDKLGIGKFEPMWHGPCIIKRVLAKSVYELVDYDGVPLGKPRNALYLKKYFA